MKYLHRVTYLRNTYIASVSIVLFLIIYNFFFVYPSFNKMLVTNTEAQAVRLATHLVYSVLTNKYFLKIEHVNLEEIAIVQEQLKLWKLKIFADDGLVVFSTNPNEIGEVNTKDYFREKVAKGIVISKAVEKNEMSSEGKNVPLHIVETYAPIMDGDKFLGAFEIYYDITNQKERQDDNLLKSVSLSLVIALFFLSLMFVILERSGKTIIEHMLVEEKLKQYQKQILESQKMASLGGLVAGVAHEINTPIGAALTTASTLEGRARKYADLHNSNQLKRTDLAKFFEIATNTSEIILVSLKQAATLIGSFKQVAVDQSNEIKRPFNVEKCISDVLMSLLPKYKQARHTIVLNSPKDLEIDNYPGVFSGIITNLIMNSVLHGFEVMEQGAITIDVSTNNDKLVIKYKDNGKGMDEETLTNIYEPFFTTKRGQGGSGLGMHLVYNQVTQILGGHITCTSEVNKGCEFLIHIPYEKRENV